MAMSARGGGSYAQHDCYRRGGVFLNGGGLLRAAPALALDDGGLPTRCDFGLQSEGLSARRGYRFNLPGPKVARGARLGREPAGGAET